MPLAGLLILMLTAAASVAGLAGCETEYRDTDIKRVSVGEAKALWDRAHKDRPNLVVFIDPRPARYYDAAHIPGARHLELPRAPVKGPRDPRLERCDHILVYGDDPGHPVAKAMTKRLMAVGYKGVRWFAGGLKEWKERGYPTEPPSAPPEPGAPPAPPPSGR